MTTHSKRIVDVLQQALVYSNQNRQADALKQYELALQMDPASIETHYQLGLFFLKKREFEHALIQFNNVLALDPTVSRAVFHQGVCYFYTQRLLDAAKCFESVLKDDPNDVEAWVNLGAIALQQENAQLAIERFSTALSLDPEHEAARSNLAATFMHFNRHENALTHYLMLLKKAPDNNEYLYHAALAEMTLGQLEQARSRFLSLLKKDEKQFSVLYNLAVLLLRMNQQTEAKQYLTKALAVQPLDASCRHLMAALTGEVPDAQESVVHAQRLFDQYAMYYDQHMLSALQYQLPAMIFAMLKTHEIPGNACVLDLGCGTGLSGELLRGLSLQLIGVDISASMLSRAKEKDFYDQLIEQEAVDFLNQTDFKFDLIVVADLLPYLGELNACFQGIKRCLLPGGHVIFSVEISEQAPWRLQKTARYAHHESYIEALCQQVGIQIVAKEKKVARQQAGVGVAVWLVLGRVAGNTSDPLEIRPARNPSRDR